MMGPYHMRYFWNNFPATGSAGSPSDYLGPGMMGYNGWGMMGNYGTVFGWLFPLLWIITWVLFVAALFALVRWLWKKGDK